MNYDILLAAKNAIEPVCTTTLLVLTTWFITRTVIKKNEGKRDIILAALEKNPNPDTGELIKCFQTGFSTFKERLLKKLLWGSIFTFAGLLGLAMLLIAAIVGGEANKDVYAPVILFAAPALAVGISFLLNCFIGKNMLAKEIEAEKKQRPKE